MNVSDVMTHGVVSIGPEASVRDAVACMARCDVSGLPVVDAAGTLVGMLTEGDLLRRVEMATEAARPRWLERLFAAGAGADDYARSHGRRVADVMTASVVTVSADAPLGEVVRLMEAHAIRRLPVVAGGRVVGIVSRTDLVGALAACLAEGLPPASDAAIRRAIVAQMKREPWCPVGTVEVAVRDGVVDLTGFIHDERQRRALRVLAGNVDGVKRVRDALTRANPLTGSVIDEPPPGSTD